jgi:hypothetical protein
VPKKLAFYFFNFKTIVFGLYRLAFELGKGRHIDVNITPEIEDERTGDCPRCKKFQVNLASHVSRCKAKPE